jgi:hypothetical protein
MNGPSGGQNVFIGNYAGKNNTTSQGLFVGEYAGEMNTTGTRNSFLGFFAGQLNQTGEMNTYVGQFAGMDNLMSRNTYVGYWAGGSNVNGQYNAYLGWRAGQGTSGSNNVLLGYQTGEANTGSGNVFIGYQAGMSSGATANSLYINNASGTPLIYGDFTAEEVGIFTTAPTATLDVNGTVRVRSIGSGAYSTPVNRMADGTLTTATSDARFKENIRPITDALDKVLSLKGVEFNWIGDENHSDKIGFIAQDVEKVIPELVFTNEADGYKGINYAEMTAVLAEAVKAQQKQIEDLKSEVTQLKKELEKGNNKKKGK